MYRVVALASEATASHQSCLYPSHDIPSMAVTAVLHTILTCTQYNVEIVKDWYRMYCVWQLQT